MTMRHRVHLFTSSPHSGLLKAILSDSIMLKKMGYEVVYVIPKSKRMKYGGTYSDNVRILRESGEVKEVNLAARSNFDLIKDFFVFIQKMKTVSFLITYGNYAGKLGRILYAIGKIRKLYHVPQCTEFERKESFHRTVEKVWEKILRNQQSLLIACSPSEIFSLVEEIGADPRLVVLSPNSVETPSPQSRGRRKGKLKYKYLVVCRATKDKQIATVLEAVSLLSEADKAVVIGDGPELVNLKLKYPRVVFIGYQTREKIQEYMLQSEYILSASLVEGMSFSILDAMNIGLVPILSNVRGHKDIIINGHNGFLFDSPEDLCVILFRMSLIDEGYYNRVSYAAQNTVSKLREINKTRIKAIFK